MYYFVDDIKHKNIIFIKVSVFSWNVGSVSHLVQSYLVFWLEATKENAFEITQYPTLKRFCLRILGKYIADIIYWTQMTSFLYCIIIVYGEIYVCQVPQVCSNTHHCEFSWGYLLKSLPFCRFLHSTTEFSLRFA